MGCPTEVQAMYRCLESWGMQGYPHEAKLLCGAAQQPPAPLWQQARLFSYDSVQKNLQQQIHRMTAQCFRLWACRELPLSYEEALRSLPEPPPNRSSVHPSQKAAPSLLKEIPLCRREQLPLSCPFQLLQETGRDTTELVVMPPPTLPS